ncbi:hypothetical protein [Variovorax sp. E3]|uniref:hypothetical protein n=1 Tax=Variovorax sp. E3 TaxID=1914993 RepID=UPI0018DE40C4|nr:hypothetical protein [Variovorax sp. E3]
MTKQMPRIPSCTTTRRPPRAAGVAAALSLSLLLAFAGTASAQLVNYGEAMGAYKDNRDSGVRVIDQTTPGVTAKARVRVRWSRTRWSTRLRWYSPTARSSCRRTRPTW